MRAGPWFNIKMSSYQYRKSHCGDKTVVRSSYLHNGISYTGKMASLYWIRALPVMYLWQSARHWCLNCHCTGDFSLTLRHPYKIAIKILNDIMLLWQILTALKSLLCIEIMVFIPHVACLSRKHGCWLMSASFIQNWNPTKVNSCFIIPLLFAYVLLRSLQICAHATTAVLKSCGDYSGATWMRPIEISLKFINDKCRIMSDIGLGCVWY